MDENNGLDENVQKLAEKVTHVDEKVTNEIPTNITENVVSNKYENSNLINVENPQEIEICNRDKSDKTLIKMARKSDNEIVILDDHIVAGLIEKSPESIHKKLSNKKKDLKTELR